jgi:hypothetical protein
MEPRIRGGGGAIGIKQGNLSCCVDKEQRLPPFLYSLKKCWYKLVNGDTINIKREFLFGWFTGKGLSAILESHANL